MIESKVSKVRSTIYTLVVLFIGVLLGISAMYRWHESDLIHHAAIGVISINGLVYDIGNPREGIIVNVGKKTYAIRLPMGPNEPCVVCHCEANTGSVK